MRSATEPAGDFLPLVLIAAIEQGLPKQLTASEAEQMINLLDVSQAGVGRARSGHD